MERESAPARSKRQWVRKTGENDLPWGRIWGLPYHPARTPKDRKASLRILYRSVQMRTWEDSCAHCRLCHKVRDTLAQLAKCEVDSRIYRQRRRTYLPKNGKFWQTYWHPTATGIRYYAEDTEGVEFDSGAFVFSAIRRLTVRMEAYAQQV